jgi:hypothetical protein
LISADPNPDGSSPLTNTIPGDIITPVLFQDSMQAKTLNNYTITFTPTNELPADGSIKLVFPE